MSKNELGESIVDAARKMISLGLSTGTAGNISVRDGNGFLITPSGLAPEKMSPGELITFDGAGSWSAADGALRPSSEWRLHRDVLAARGDIHAILHAHPPFATALACLRRDIPAFHYMVAVAGGAVIRCSAYATFGTAELSAAALEALGERKACLLANHGIIACGSSVEEALALAVEVEGLAAQYTHALQIGQPELLDDGEMQRVLKKFRAGYGYGSGPEEA